AVSSVHPTDTFVPPGTLPRASLPHPETWHVRPGRPYDGPPAPLVLKPRHGSWGRHVTLCETDDALRRELRAVREEPWFRQHGALVQELVPPTGSDLRLRRGGGQRVRR